jgi:hypothetical protein
MAGSAVYIISAHEAPVKIGMSNEPGRRLADLQVGFPDELFLHHAAFVPAKVARKAEQACHDELAPYRRRGEWFDVTVTTAIEVVNRVAQRVANENFWSLPASAGALEYLDAKYGLGHDAASAVSMYRRALSGTNTAAILRGLDDHIASRAGAAGLAHFKAILIERKSLDDTLPDTRTERWLAEQGLCVAINALSDAFHNSPFGGQLPTDRAQSSRLARLR